MLQFVKINVNKIQTLSRTSGEKLKVTEQDIQLETTVVHLPCPTQTSWGANAK